MSGVHRLAAAVLTAACAWPVLGCGSDAEPSSSSTAASAPSTTASALTSTVPPAPATTTTSTTSRKPRPPKRKAARSDSAIQSAQAFYFAMDDLAIELDDAIGQALDGGESDAELRSISRRIHQRNDKRLLSSGETSVGGNELASAATEAVEAAAAGQTRDLIDVRRDIVTARGDLAEEAVR